MVLIFKKKNNGSDLVGKGGLSVFIPAFYVAYILLIFLSELWTREIWIDEALTYFQVQGKSFGDLITSLEYGVNAVPYLYFILIWCVEQLTELNVLSLRFPSFLFSVLTVLCLHTLLRKTYSNVVAIVSISMGLLLFPQFMYYTAEARPYSALMFFVVINLMTTIRLKKGGWPVYLTNAVTSLLAPSIHYCGLFYSGALAVAFLLSEGPGGLRKSTSFCIGWIIFFVLHSNQIFLFLNGETLAQAWIPMPTMPGFISMLKSFGMGAGKLILLLMLIYLLGQFNWAVATEVSSKRKHDESKFLVLVVLCWFMVPVSFYIMAWTGLPNLAHWRYYYPTSLSGVLYTAFFLHLFLNSQLNDPLSSKWPLRVFLVCFLIVNSIFVFSIHLKGFQKGPIFNQKNEQLIRRLFIDFNGSRKTPIVVGNSLTYFHLIYHYPDERSNCYFLRETEAESTGWSNFHPEIRSLTPEKLSKYENFIYIDKPSVNVNNYPHFSISSWGKSNGYNVKKQEFSSKPHFPIIYYVQQI